MDKTKILEKYLYQAVDLFYQNDVPYLVDKNGELSASERSYVFRVAHYLQNMLETDKRFKDVVVDCEYGDATSTIGQELHKYMSEEGIKAYTNKKNKNCIFPDLIVHKRHTHNKNLLVAEFKGYWNKDSWKNDEKKLELFTKVVPHPNIKQFFYYQIGVFIAFGKRQKHAVVFKNGVQITTDTSIEKLQQQKDKK